MFVWIRLEEDRVGVFDRMICCMGTGRVVWREYEVRHGKVMT